MTSAPKASAVDDIWWRLSQILRHNDPSGSEQTRGFARDTNWSLRSNLCDLGACLKKLSSIEVSKVSLRGNRRSHRQRAAVSPSVSFLRVNHFMPEKPVHWASHPEASKNRQGHGQTLNPINAFMAFCVTFMCFLSSVYKPDVLQCPTIYQTHSSPNQTAMFCAHPGGL